MPDINITWPANIITRADYLQFVNDPSSTALDDAIDFLLPAVNKAVIQHCNREFREYEEAAISVYCSDTVIAGVVTLATVEITDTTIVLTSVGGDNPGIQTKTFADGTDDTLAEIVVTISALDAWTATLRHADGSLDTDDLTVCPVQSCLTSTTAAELGIRADATEYFDGEGQTRIWPVRIPVTSITSIYVNNDQPRDFTDSNDELDSDYYLIQKYGDHVQRIDGGAFNTGYQNIRLIYQGGYAESAIPEDLKRAGYMILSAQRKLAGKEHVRSETVSVEGTTFNTQFTAELPWAATRILANYRRIPV